MGIFQPLINSGLIFNDSEIEYHSINILGDNITISGTSDGILNIDLSNVGGVVSNYGLLHYVSDDNESSTNNVNDFQEKLALSVNLDYGKYLLRWYYEWKASKVNKDYYAQIEVNSEIVAEHNECLYQLATITSIPKYGFHVFNYSGQLDCGLFFKTGDKGTTAYMKRARLGLWRLE